MGRHTLDELPDWPRGTATVLATAGSPPHLIAVSTALRSGPHTVLLALSGRRDSLARLREDPAAALCVMAEGMAFTAEGSATVTHDPLPGAGNMVAVRLEVQRIQDHHQPTFELRAGVDWAWSDPDAAERDDGVRAALARLAG